MPDEIGTSLTTAAVVVEAYRDVLQPSARRVGVSLETLTKVALSPIGVIEWGYEKSADWLRSKMEARLAAMPEEYIVEPKGNIVSAALSHIAVSYDTPELRDLYAELLLKAMDSRAATNVHPAYFAIIAQLSPQEALVLVGLHERGESELFSEKVDPYTYGLSADRKPTIEEQFDSFCASTLLSGHEQSAIWLTNLCRLGLLALDTYPEAVLRPEEADRRGVHPAQVDNYEHRNLSFTKFGRAFIVACAPVGSETEHSA